MFPKVNKRANMRHQLRPLAAGTADAHPRPKDRRHVRRLRRRRGVEHLPPDRQDLHRLQPRGHPVHAHPEPDRHLDRAPQPHQQQHMSRRTARMYGSRPRRRCSCRSARRWISRRRRCAPASPSAIPTEFRLRLWRIRRTAARRPQGSGRGAGKRGLTIQAGVLPFKG